MISLGLEPLFEKRGRQFFFRIYRGLHFFYFHEIFDAQENPFEESIIFKSINNSISPGTLIVSDVALGSMTQTVILPGIWRIRMLPFSKYAYSERSISNHIYLPRVFSQYSTSEKKSSNPEWVCFSSDWFKVLILNFSQKYARGHKMAFKNNASNISFLKRLLSRSQEVTLGQNFIWKSISELYLNKANYISKDGLDGSFWKKWSWGHRDQKFW